MECAASDQYEIVQTSTTIKGACEIAAEHLKIGQTLDTHCTLQQIPKFSVEMKIRKI